MRFHFKLAFVLALSATAALTVACGGGPTTAVGPGVVGPASNAKAALAPMSAANSIVGLSDSIGTLHCAKAKVYVADYLRNDVEIYSQGATAPCRKIATGISSPEAVYVDGKGTLYVANYIGSTVTEYLPGKKTPNLTITTPASPYDLFVGRDHTLYVAEATADTVVEYAAGATVPERSLAINGGPHGVATDNKNNLYVSYLSNTDGVSHVEKFAPKATTGTDMGFTVGFAGELKLDSHNDIIIGDRNASIVYVYPPGATSPSRSFSSPAGKPVDFALNQAETDLYMSGFSSVTIIDYQTGAATGSISTGLVSPSGVAVYPPAPY